MNKEWLLRDPEDESLNRPINRGGMKILRELIVYKHYHYSPINNMVEFGVGGGGKHVFWSNVFREGNVYGIEIFHPEAERVKGWGQEMIDWHMVGYELSIHQASSEPNLTLLHGYDGYLQESVDEIKKHLGDNKLDLIVDDGNPNGNKTASNRIDVQDLWKDTLAEDGFFWSDTILGQGTGDAEELYNTFENEQYIKNFAERGWVIFDLTKYSAYDNLRANSNSYFGIWAHDLTLYGDILQNYEDCILNGRENF